jgi:carbamoyl-phosphate synthase small subunit
LNPLSSEIPAAAGYLVLEDGSEFHGTYIGRPAAVAGEVVFTTAMAGYLESLTDPSFAGQLLVSTYPLIGNYGVPSVSSTGGRPTPPMQSERIQVQAYIVQSLAPFYSHHRAVESLSSWLARHDVPILTGIDTRALTMRLRERGTMAGWLAASTVPVDEAKRTARCVDLHAQVFLDVAPKQTVTYEGGPNRVLLIDVGAKEGIVDCLLRRESTVVRAPWHADLRRLAESVDGIVIGNGPGDPADLGELIAVVRTLLGSFSGPIFGVCLGHQLLGRALGLPTFKLPYGHRGVNQPVRNVVTGACFISSQNHGYAVDDANLPRDCAKWFTNLNDGTSEGLRLVSRPVRSVQFHPEGMPGPRDAECLFDEFVNDVAHARVAGCPA